MSEENNSETVVKGEVVSTSSMLTVKDLLIPISIVVAGLFVGAGLYFGGAPMAPDKEEVIIQPVVGGVSELAKAAGVKEKAFDECVNNGDTVAVVETQMEDAFETGGRGTPWSILIGPNGKKYPVNGALPLASIKQLVEVAKAEAAEGPGSSEEELAYENMDPVTESDNIKGNPDAGIVIVEYSDFDCPFCTRFHATMNQVVKEYDGEVAWVYRHFPLEQLHPNAKSVAIASECVAKLEGNDAFWKFADSYLSN
ncbi:thioredoxin domain-containing protein [Candidatus Kaiserbacteria bacterium]|nr:thioredoxin domain-containing protein [Candidatus Kaiserbacteria bacterium]